MKDGDQPPTTQILPAIPDSSASDPEDEATAEETGEVESQSSVSVADGVERSLDPRSVQLQRLTGWIAAIVVSFGMLVGLLIALVFAPFPIWLKTLLIFIWLLTTFTMAWSAHFWPGIEHRHASYRVDGLGIEILRGVLWRKVISIPLSRIQHIDVSQGPLERSYELGTLVIYTAGAEYAKVELGGLAHSTALRIRDHLLPREVDDAV